MKSYTKHFEGIGDILFQKSRRARRLNISIRPERGIRVAVPRGIAFGIAEKFALENLNWIKRKLNSQKERITSQEKVPLPDIPRDQAKIQLTKRLQELSRLTGLDYNRVFIKNQKTLWGSCSSKKNINLNIKLLSLPQHLQDYVIIHELVHTKELNHSPRFWNLLQCFLPNCLELRKELRRFSPRHGE